MHDWHVVVMSVLVISEVILATQPRSYWSNAVYTKLQGVLVVLNSVTINICFGCRWD